MQSAGCTLDDYYLKETDTQWDGSGSIRELN